MHQTFNIKDSFLLQKNRGVVIQRRCIRAAREIKSGETIQPDFFKGLKIFKKISGVSSAFLVYGGNDLQERKHGTVYGWQKTTEMMDAIFLKE